MKKGFSSPMFDEVSVKRGSDAGAPEGPRSVFRAFYPVVPAFFHKNAENFSKLIDKKNQCGRMYYVALEFWKFFVNPRKRGEGIWVNSSVN